MLILRATTDELRVNTGSAGAIKCTVHWIEVDNATPPVVQDMDATTTASITTATTTAILTCTTANRRRNVRFGSVFNDHATVSNLTRVLHYDGAVESPIWQGTLLAGEFVNFNEAGDWWYYGADGILKATSVVAATQAEMEAAASTSAFVTPGRQHNHPGHPKFRVKAGLTGNILEAYNVTSLTDTGIGALTITIATDFSNTNWTCLATIELASTVIAQSCTYDAPAAGTVILRSVVEAGSATDPVTWSCAGLGDQ
jgi:hypothetical protein